MAVSLTLSLGRFGPVVGPIDRCPTRPMAAGFGEPAINANRSP